LLNGCGGWPYPGGPGRGGGPPAGPEGPERPGAPGVDWPAGPCRAASGRGRAYQLQWLANDVASFAGQIIGVAKCTSEGRQRKFQHGVLRFQMFCFTSEILHHCDNRASANNRGQTGETVFRTHPKNGWVIGDRRWLVLLHGRRLLNPKVLHIASAEDDIFVDLVRRCYFVCRGRLTTFSAVRSHIFEGNSGLVRIDLVEGTNVTIQDVSPMGLS